MTLESVLNAPPLPQKLRGRVLLAEDSPDNRGLIGACLHRLGIDYAFAENGEQAVQQAMTEDFDLILMDIQMPVMDGLTATEILRASSFGAPIVALTANVMTEDVERYLQNGFTRCVGKPIDFGEFTRVLAELLIDKQVGSDKGSDKSATPATSNPMMELCDMPEFQPIKAEYESRFPERLATLKAHIEGGAWAEAEGLAHKLKGSAGTYGYPEVTQIAHHIEQHIKNQAYNEALIAMGQMLNLASLQKFLYAGKQNEEKQG